jgi:hypothetical protein
MQVIRQFTGCERSRPVGETTSRPSAGALLRGRYDATMTVADMVGWVATGGIVSSYFFRDQTALRRVQAMSAVVWMVYGILIHSAPVIVANVIVCAAAAVSSLRMGRRKPQPQTP